MQVQHSYNSSTNGENLLPHVLALSATEARIQILVFTKLELTTSAPVVGVRGYLLGDRSDDINPPLGGPMRATYTDYVDKAGLRGYAQINTHTHTRFS